MAWVKLIEQEPGRPNGRLRIRLLNERTNEVVCDSTGRTFFFQSEDEADKWIGLHCALAPAWSGREFK